MQNEDQNEQEYLKELAPTLFGKKQEIRKEAPEGYFEDLPGKLLQRVAAEKAEQPKGKIIHLINFRNLAVAAGIAVLLALVPLVSSLLDESAEVETQVSLEQLDFHDEITFELVAEYVDAETVYESIIADDLDSRYLVDAIDNDDIINYLLEDEISDELLYELNF